MPVRYLCLAALLLTGCDNEPKPLASESADFVGVWELGRFGQDARYTYLQITASGQLAYAKIVKSANSSSCVAMAPVPVTSITDSQIQASLLWFFSVDFVVDRPPRQSGETWRMTVDGNELTRTDGRLEDFDYSWSCEEGELLREPADGAPQRV